MRLPGLRALLGVTALVCGLSGVAACGDSTASTESATGATVEPDAATDAPTSAAAVDSKDLPEGFPSGDVPLLDETVLNATQGKAGGPFAWSVVMQSSRSVEDLSEEVQKDYASWRTNKGTGTSLGDVSILHFADARYDVGVTIARTGGNVTITYVVKDAA